LLRQSQLQYLYGCVGADITQAKRYTLHTQAHCHSWKVGWRIFSAARSDPERSFAYGYLTHLAADIYSHNHFIPVQLIVTFRARALRHAYWEARFDSMQPVRYRLLLRRIRRSDFPACDALLERIVARTLFSFRTNKRIFDSVLAFHEWENWHQAMRYVATRSRYSLSPRLVRRYNRACLANILDVLKRGKAASCQSIDPTGLAAIGKARSIRRTLKELDRLEAIGPAVKRQLHALNRRAELGPPPGTLLPPGTTLGRG